MTFTTDYLNIIAIKPVFATSSTPRSHLRLPDCSKLARLLYEIELCEHVREALADDLCTILSIATRQSHADGCPSLQRCCENHIIPLAHSFCTHLAPANTMCQSVVCSSIWHIWICMTLSSKSSKGEFALTERMHTQAVLSMCLQLQLEAISWPYTQDQMLTRQAGLLPGCQSQRCTALCLARTL